MTEDDEAEVQRKLKLFEGFVTRKGAIIMLIHDKKNEAIRMSQENKKRAQEPETAFPEPSGISHMIGQELEKADNKLSEDTIRDIESLCGG